MQWVPLVTAIGRSELLRDGRRVRDGLRLEGRLEPGLSSQGTYDSTWTGVSLRGYQMVLT